MSQGSPEDLAKRLTYGDPRSADHAAIADEIERRRDQARDSIENSLRDHVLLSTEALEQAAEVMQNGYLVCTCHKSTSVHERNDR